MKLINLCTKHLFSLRHGLAWRMGRQTRQVPRTQVVAHRPGQIITMSCCCYTVKEACLGMVEPREVGTWLFSIDLLAVEVSEGWKR